jgi:hypothetical protein
VVVVSAPKTLLVGILRGETRFLGERGLFGDLDIGLFGELILLMLFFFKDKDYTTIPNAAATWDVAI